MKGPITDSLYHEYSCQIFTISRFTFPRDPTFIIMNQSWRKTQLRKITAYTHVVISDVQVLIFKNSRIPSKIEIDLISLSHKRLPKRMQFVNNIHDILKNTFFFFKFSQYNQRFNFLRHALWPFCFPSFSLNRQSCINYNECTFYIDKKLQNKQRT